MLLAVELRGEETRDGDFGLAVERLRAGLVESLDLDVLPGVLRQPPAAE